MSQTRVHIKKLIAMRLWINDHDLAKKNPAATYAACKRLSIWLDAYPLAKDEQVRRWAASNMADIAEILPGKACPNHATMINTLNNLLYGQQQAIAH